jgi:hypothetical protein
VEPKNENQDESTMSETKKDKKDKKRKEPTPDEEETKEEPKKSKKAKTSSEDTPTEEKKEKKEKVAREPAVTLTDEEWDTLTDEEIRTRLGISIIAQPLGCLSFLFDRHSLPLVSVAQYLLSSLIY